ncbi:MAG: rhodanese-like domain-containing protein [Phycisphaerales bacterium]
MSHPPRFLALVEDARTRIEEWTVDETHRSRDRGDGFLLIDVREDREWLAGRIPGAIHLGKGVIERDVEAAVPAKDQRMVLYCGGGFRSALAADQLRVMGYTDAISMDGGIRGWRESGLPVDEGPPAS